MHINAATIIANDGVLNEDEETFAGGDAGCAGDPPGRSAGGGAFCSAVAEIAPDGTVAVSVGDT